MPKFFVSLERRFWQTETLTVPIEAKDKAEARKIVKREMNSLYIAEHEGWEASDSGYDDYGIEDIEEAE